MNNVMYSMLLIAITAVVTLLLRAFSFIVFGGNRQMPEQLKKVVSLLPPGIMAVLLVYCLKGDIVSISMGTVSSLISVAIVVLLHLWKRNTLLSIAVGTVVYMALIRFFA